MRHGDRRGCRELEDSSNSGALSTISDGQLHPRGAFKRAGDDGILARRVPPSVARNSVDNGST